MKSLISFLTFISLLVFMSSCSDDSLITKNESGIQSVTTLEKGSGPSANGQGTLLLNGNRQTFAFHAREKNGIVSGNIQVVDRNWGIVYHGEINCMVIDENVATLSGEITRDSEGIIENYPDWKYFWFRVIDNGEGNNAVPDEFSDIYCFIEFFPCDIEVPLDAIPMFEILNGNFQVKL